VTISPAAMVLGLVQALAAGGPAVVTQSAPVEVTAAGRCPEAADVDAELRRMGAATTMNGPEGPADRAVVIEELQGLRVRLFRAGGDLFGDRSIVTSADCGERAIAAAVLIGAWRSELRSELKVEMDALGPERRATLETPRWRPSVGAAGLAVTSAADSWALGVALDGQLTHRAGWSGRATVWGAAVRDETLGEGPGRAQWTRWALGIGPSYEGTGPGATVASLFAQVAVARIHVAGEGFPVRYRNATFDWGVRAGVEAGLRLGALVPLVGAGVAFWPRSQRAIAIGSDETRALPAVDVLVTLGLRWEARR
jgi:hypothetical protein